MPPQVIQKTDKKLLINNIFWSIQGEGERSGWPSIFVRLTGCTLQCRNCDTKDAWKNGRDMKIDDIATRVNDLKNTYPLSQVVITGGEPLEQDLRPLVQAFKSRDYCIAIETNGIYFQELNIDWWTVSPKDMAVYYISQHLYNKINEVKLIVTQNLNLDIVSKIREINTSFPIFLQPDFHEKNRYLQTFNFFKKCQEKGIKNIRLGIQLQTVFSVE